ncbi:uncharacterized protein QC763_206180 [Podospora pseudopauciseta]|uniref:Uncharacterized protein n=3 Tax=Podospora TaxID=5144 RepID=A0ABY6S2S9_PODCO|nr:hypothetical protein QC763_206180 [Podospora pseudopauciseta]KAK4679666.1 hypothetical protein QC764_206180 [Podospora pseudoanserina]VBB75695.1 Putative protein of unknown function [Podospora comata]
MTKMLSLVLLLFASLSRAQDNTPLPLPSPTSTTSVTVPWSSIPVPPAATGTVWSSTSAPTSAPAASGGSGAATGQGAVCGKGFTYCGYILRDHQGFAEADIVKSYCSASKENCLDGKTKTDPIQALYVCVPPDNSTTTLSLTSNISPNSNPYANSDDGSSSHSSFFRSLFSGFGSNNNKLHPRGFNNKKRQAPVAGAGGGSSCSLTDTPGNKIELLCSCGGTCLNPDKDHIGRCDAPCN